MTTTDHDPADAVAAGHQPSLEGLELPEYHGRRPVRMKTALIGVGTRTTRAHSIGDRFVLVLEVRMKTSTARAPTPPAASSPSPSSPTSATPTHPETSSPRPRSPRFARIR